MVIGIMLHVICMLEKIKYLYIYNKIRIKRLLIHTSIIFILQFLIIINFRFQDATLPMYPPIGVAFVMFYLFGSNAFLGLLLSEFCGLFLHNFTINTIYVYLFADLGAAWLGAYFSKNIFFLDLDPLIIQNKLLNFIKKMFFICCLSSLIKIKKLLWLNYINLWVADLNAILIIASFVLSWIYVPFSQYKISHQLIKKSSTIILIFFIASSILFMKNIGIIYLIIINMITAIYWAYYYGFLIATILSFIISSIYLTYFIKHQDLSLYSPIVLLVFVICMLYVSLKKQEKLEKFKKNTQAP